MEGKQKDIQGKDEKRTEGREEVQVKEETQAEKGQREEIILKREEYEKMLKELEDLRDKWLRTAAELENSKKRWLKERQQIIEHANADLIEKLLPLLDNFEKAIENLPPEKGEFEKGVEIIYREMNNVLGKFGLVKIDGLRGRQFDPFEHEAIAYEEDEEIPEGMIIEVLRSGYKLGNRLLRPALVKVSKGSSKAKDDVVNKGTEGGEEYGKGDRD